MKQTHNIEVKKVIILTVESEIGNGATERKTQVFDLDGNLILEQSVAQNWPNLVAGGYTIFPGAIPVQTTGVINVNS